MSNSTSAPLGIDDLILDHDQDPTPRRRNGNGDSMGRSAFYRVPTAGRALSKDGHFEALAAQLAKASPVRALCALHHYDEKLVPAYLNVVRVREAAEQDLAKAQRAAAAQRELVQAQIDAHNAEADSVLARLEQNLEAFKQAFRAAEVEASVACGKVGVAYEDGLAEAQVLAVRRISYEEAAAQLGLPAYGSKQSFFAKFIIGVGTLGIGALTGLSIGIVAGILDPSSLAYQAVELGVSAAIGIAVSAFARYAVKALFQTAADVAFCSKPQLVKTLPGYGLAFGGTAAILASYLFMERQGIMKLASLQSQMDSLSGKHAAAMPEHVFFLVAAVISLGYFAFSAAEGFREGRDRQVLARCVHFVEGQFAQAIQARREDPAVQAALAKVANVRCAKAALLSAQQAVDAAKAEAERRRLELERALPTVPTEFNAVQLQRIQDAHDDYQGAQIELDRIVDRLVDEAEPLGGFFTRLARAFFPNYRRARRFQSARG